MHAPGWWPHGPLLNSCGSGGFYLFKFSRNLFFLRADIRTHIKYTTHRSDKVSSKSVGRLRKILNYSSQSPLPPPHEILRTSVADDPCVVYDNKCYTPSRDWHVEKTVVERHCCPLRRRRRLRTSFVLPDFFKISPHSV